MTGTNEGDEMRSTNLTLSAASLALVAATTSAHAAQPSLLTSDRAGVESGIGHYFLAGDTASSAELRKAFHPATMMFFAGKDGRLTGVSQPEWWSRTDAAKSPTKAMSRAIPMVDTEAGAGSAKVVSDYAAHQFQDYMLLVKLGDEWKIVSKVFYRREPADAPMPAGEAAAADRQAVEDVLKAKLAAMDAVDGDALAKVYHPRAMTYTVLDGQLVGVPIAEWQARYAADRDARKAAAAKARRRIVSMDVTPTAATAKLEHDLGDQRWVDYANLVKADGQWRIVGLVYQRADRASETGVSGTSK